MTIIHKVLQNHEVQAEDASDFAGKKNCLFNIERKY